MAYNICHKFLHLVFFIFSLLLLWLKITISTSISNQLVPAAAHFKCIDKERDALLDFKAHIDQDTNDDLSTWTTDECCKWVGVTCNNQRGHVTELYLSNSYLGGNAQEFSKNLGFLKVIDLSRNNLTGHIPYELTDLHGLVALNLSNNALEGKIPGKIGEMRDLQALDVSRNNLSGGIPVSMSNMHFLSYLDVSFNNLSGRIPSSTQLQTFDPSRYTGNAGLCGLPLTKYCPGEEGSEAPPVAGESEDYEKATDGLQMVLYRRCHWLPYRILDSVWHFTS